MKFEFKFYKIFCVTVNKFCNEYVAKAMFSNLIRQNANFLKFGFPSLEINFSFRKEFLSCCVYDWPWKIYGNSRSKTKKKLIFIRNIFVKVKTN